MIVAFSGWRGWTDEAFIHAQVDKRWSHLLVFGPNEDVLFRVGDAIGVDRIVRDYLTSLGVEPVVYVADWEREGVAAGAHRNKRMLRGSDDHDPQQGRVADLLVAFPEPDRIRPHKGSGTWNAAGLAHYWGVEVSIPAYLAPVTTRVEAADLFEQIAATL